MYSAQVLEHFENPRGVGDIPEATTSVELRNPACGDVLRLSLKIEAGRIVDARFRAQGCVPAIACASKLVETIVGSSTGGAARLRASELAEALGGLPQASSHAAALAIEVLQAALRKASSLGVDIVVGECGS
jgi:nitrogen fixation NifU-like protein